MAVLGTTGSSFPPAQETGALRDGHVERNGVRYAVKRVSLASSEDPSVTRLRGLVFLLAQARPFGFPTIRRFVAHPTRAEIVMDERQGMTLADRVAQGAFTITEVVEIAYDIGRALAELHELGERHGLVMLDDIVMDQAGGWCLRDYGQCFSSELPRRRHPEKAGDPSGSGRDVRADLVGLAKVLGACLVQVESGDVAKLTAMASSLQDPRSAVTEQAGMRGFVRELESGFPAICGPRDQERMHVARQTHLERLRRVHSAHAGFRTVVLRGSPGSGKTHLARAFRAALGPVRVLQATCRNWDVSRFGAVRQLLEGSICDRGILVPERLEELLDIAGDLARFLRPISPMLGAAIPAGGRVPEAEASDEVYVEALAEVLARRLRRAIQVVIIDDIQWLDEASRKVLSRAFQKDDLDIMLVCSTRDDLHDALQAQRLLATVERTIVWDQTLEPLEPQQAAEVVSEYLGVLGVARDQAQALALLGDGTPLSVHEIIRSVLEAGLLVPSWHAWEVDLAGVLRLRLPKRTLELISKRLDGLSRESFSILQLAAVLGGDFDARIVGAATDPSLDELSGALKEAHQYALLERAAQHSYRFVHQCIRDALTSSLSGPELQRIHARIVDAIRSIHGADLASLDAGVVFQLAHHCREAGNQGDMNLAFASNAEAGKRAIAAFDNRSALLFLTFAETIANDQQCRVVGLACQIGEAHLRLGDLDASMRAFSKELRRLESAKSRAHVWSRLATIHEARHDSERALDCVHRAFQELGEPQPKLGVSSAWQLFRALLASEQKAPPPPLEPEERTRIEELCTLYFQTTRLSVVSGRLAAVLDVSARCIRAAERLGPSQALSKAYTFKGFLLASFGRRGAAARVTRLALEMARGIEDPPATAHVLVNQVATVCWQGDTNRGLELGAEVIEQYRNWLLPSEFAMMLCNQDLLESIRGCGLAGFRWLSLASSRSLKSESRQPVSEYLLLRLQAAVLNLGTEETHGHELRELEARSLAVPRGSAYYCWTHGPRVRVFTETGELGEAFESYVNGVEDEGHDPRRVHLVMVEYYTAVAHARVHQCLRAMVPNQEGLLALKRSARDLLRAARVPLVVAHALAIDAYVCFFEGKLRKAERLFDEAERLGEEHGAPWVLYAAARGRAHLYQRQGRLGAALEQASLAERTARENGAVHRARWIREEFDLATQQLEPVHAELEQRQRRLQALVRITHAGTRGFDAERQARLVLDELIAAMSAERGTLFQRNHPGGRHPAPTSVAELRQVAARSSEGADLAPAGFAHQATLEQALRSREVQVSAFAVDGEASRCILVAPLVVQETVLGAVCLESAPGSTPYTQEDGEVLRSLAGQIPMALELAHALRDRERLEEDLRHSQKMEALGRLAGGVAHDFNNMLSAIQISVDSMLAESSHLDPHHPDLETIQQASDRASGLTRQLLAFSRREAVEARPIDLNAAVQGIVPMLKRLLGHEIEIRIEASTDLYRVKADAGQIEQVLVNLSVNALDAMGGKGTLTIRTRNVELREGQVATLQAGEYAVMEVSDDGRGMDEATRRRVFEPFFTTKAHGAGTGLGMAIVYGIVQQSGGHIDVRSDVGVGTDIVIHLPRTHEERVSVPVPSAIRRFPTHGRVLLVDDEPLVRHSFARVLRRMGCQLITASHAGEAIELLSRRPELDLVITDVVMPEMNGVELIKRLSELGVRAKVLYVSGFAADLLADRAGLGDRVDFLAKPVGVRQFEDKVRELLQEGRANRPEALAGQ